MVTIYSYLYLELKTYKSCLSRDSLVDSAAYLERGPRKRCTKTVWLLGTTRWEDGKRSGV